MSYTRFGTFYNCFTFGMSAYGFTRGYRSIGGGLQHRHSVPSSTSSSTSSSTPSASTTVYLPLLSGQRFAGGIVNGMMYALPGWNAVHLYHLFNRLEIQLRGYSIDHYPEEYHEWTGWCYDTL